jgi:ethanolamine ammonia-lyase small subunit
LPTARLLEFQAAHAAARDAVHLPFDPDAVGRALDPLPWRIARSRAPDRATYLRRPDLGRRIDPDDLAALAATGGGPFDAAIVVADGLSARAVYENAAPLAVALAGLLAGWRLAPVVLVRQGRVAAGERIDSTSPAAAARTASGNRRSSLQSPPPMTLPKPLAWGALSLPFQRSRKSGSSAVASVLSRWS